jgi:hypothetical protein
MSTTTIQIDVEIRDQLRARGRMGESYNDVIRRLLLASPSREAPRAEVRELSSAASSKPWIPRQDRG